MAETGNSRLEENLNLLFRGGKQEILALISIEHFEQLSTSLSFVSQLIEDLIYAQIKPRRLQIVDLAVRPRDDNDSLWIQVLSPWPLFPKEDLGQR